MSDFYLTLLSNASADGFIGDFKSRLPSNIRLDKAYEVALVSMIYPATHELLTMRREGDSQLAENEIRVYPVGEGGTTIPIAANSFTGPSELSELLNFSIAESFRYNHAPVSSDEETVCKFLEEQARGVRQPGITGDGQPPVRIFNYNQLTKRCTLDVDPRFTRIDLSPKLEYILGLPAVTKKFPHTGVYPVASGTDFMYVYLNNLIEPQIYSHDRQPIIKVISVPPGAGENVELNFNNPLYVPVRAREFDHIWVQLKNDRNQVINFQSGKVALVLHFRRRHQSS